MSDQPEMRGWCAPPEVPLAVRHSRMWVGLHRLSARHARVGRCGCGKPKDQEIHKVCASCAAGDRVHARAVKLREDLRA